MDPNQPSSTGSEPRADAPAPTGNASGGAGFGQPSPYVAEIRERLADIARREAALKLRETELEQQYRLMQQFVRDEAERELNEARARLAARSAELDAQTLDLMRRRGDLDQRADTLEAQQQRMSDERRALEDAERALGAAQQDFSAAATREGDERERERRTLLSRIEIIRRREVDLETRIARARDEIVRQRSTLNEQQEFAKREAAALAARRSEAEVELRTLRARHDEDFRQQRNDLAADLQRQRDELAAAAKRQQADAAAAFQRQRKDAAEELKRERGEFAAEMVRERAAAAAEAQRVEAQLDIDLRERRAELAALTAEFDERRGALEDAAAEASAGRAALANERAALDASKDDVESRRAALASEDAALIHARAELDERLKELERFDRATVQQRQDLQREIDEHAARREKLARDISALETRTTIAEQRDAQLKRRTLELRTEAEQLTARTAELGRQHRAAEADLEKRRRTAEAELEKRRTTIEASLKEKRAAAQRELDTWRAGVESDLNARQVRLDERESQIAVLEDDLLRLRDEAASLRDQAEARDAETRQSALAAELDRQQLDRDRALLEAAHSEVLSLREQRDADLIAARSALRERAERLRLAERTRFAAPRMWWLRATALGAAAAIAAGIGWLRWEKPEYRADAVFEIQSASQDALSVAGQHAAALLARTIRPDEPRNGFGDDWSAAVAEGRVTARPLPGTGDVRLSVRGADAARAGALVRTAVEEYASHVNAVEPTLQMPETFVDLTTRRSSVERDLSALRTLRDEHATLLAGLPAGEAREQLLNESLALRDQQRAAAAQLTRRREELAALLRGADPRGALDEERYEAACAADAALRQDNEEFARNAARYKVGLTAALVDSAAMLSDYTRALDAYAAEVRSRLAEQSAPATSAVLEEAAADIDRQREYVTAFETDWRAQQDVVAALTPDADIVTLIEQQVAAAEAARGLSEACRAFFAGQEARLVALTETTDGGTRSAVLANSLRSALAGMAEARRGLDRAVARVDLRGNVDLDALDRLLRGLRTHIAQRRATLREEMQLEADRDARSNYATHLDEVRTAVDALETQRETTLVRLTETLDGLRGLENVVLKRRMLEERVAFADESIAALETQLTQLDGLLAEARRSGPKPDRVVFAGRVPVAQIAGQERERHAALAAATAFGAVWLACALMLLRNPLARRRSERESDFDLPLPALPARVEST